MRRDTPQFLAAAAMTRRNILGSHLYSQIVVPLLVASIVVGVVATVLAGLFLRGLTDRWVTQVADAVTSGLVVSVDRYADEMQRLAWFTASDPVLQQAARTGDLPALRTHLAAANSPLDFDDIAVLDETGAVISAAGDSGLAEGSRPLGAQGVAAPGTGRSLRTVFAHFGDAGALVALQPFAGTDGRYYSLALVRVLTDDFLGSMAGTTSSAFCFYGPDKHLIACTGRSSLAIADDDVFAA